MARIKKFQSGQGPFPGMIRHRPLNLTPVLEALEQVRDLVHLAVVEKWVFGDSKLRALTFHHIHRIVKHALNNEVAWLSHQHACVREIPQRHR